ncbi:macrophage mannose receptor 1-like [Elgaria multicarinata webbii]|uniref:macrophage mannose receptor 1-like n=1 Tax=Elgaria multicarinata webbii TaxID=159646 RepID=UPI002FCD3B43
MAALQLLTLLVLIQPAFQVSDSDSFLIYNENLKLCIQLQASSSTIILDYCNTDNERQHFKWVSDNQILNMAVKRCLAVPSKTNQVPVTVSSCNRTIGLQKWECKNNSLLALEEEDLFLHPEGQRKGKVIVSQSSTIKSAWKIYGTKDALCSKGYEDLFTIEGNAFGAPCVFPFKYLNKWHAKCIRDDDELGQLWCGTTEDVDRDSSSGYCPVKDSHNELFWTKNHWTGDFYQINIQSALTWYQARESCQQQNAELLSIGELHEQTYLAGLTGNSYAKYWIGLNSLDFDSGWQWIDNHPLRYINWAPGHPSSETEKTCGLMVAQNGKWMNEKCLQKLGYICKRANSSLDTPVLPPDDDKPIKCQDGWVAYAGHCYRLNRDLKTWKRALLSCQKDDGNLISIHNVEEYSFVISQLGYKPTEDVLWTGLNDQKTQMYFEWSDGSPVRFTKWQRGEPTHINNIQQDCVIMRGENGDWADHFCEEEHGYICKKERLAFLPDEAEVTDPKCRKGWKRHGLYCYFIEQTPVTFSEAISVCGANKGFLASVEDRYEQAYLTSLIGLRSEKYFWIGLSDVGKPGAFNWTSGDSVVFTHWNSEMPGQQPGCVAMRTGTAAGLWDVVSCEEKAAFLCKQWAEGVTPPPAPVTTRPPPCPGGWHPSPTRNVCFKAYMEVQKHKKTWFEAQDFCREIGGDLASMHSIEENYLLLKWEIGKAVWIGLNDMDPTKGMTWSDGSPVDYKNWPLWRHSMSNDKHCYTTYGAGFWIPFRCEHLLHWICQINRGVPLKPEPNNTFGYSFKEIEDGWIAYENNEYYFSNATLPAEKSRAFCKKHGGDLTVIDGESERKFLHRYSIFYRTSMQNPYIGLILGLDRKFGWMDGTPVTYEAWAPDEPNFANDDENCVVMYLNTGSWNDVNCGTETSFICERHNSSVRSTVAPTSPAPQGGCNEGWLLFDNKCFQIFGFNENERKNWTDARADCRSRGGNLASIPSKAVQAFLTMALNGAPTDTWIGLSDANWENRFYWTDGSGVYYTNWAKGFPGYLGDCVFMMTTPERHAGNWRDDKCGAKKSYFCQRNTDIASSHSEPTIPASGYILYGNSSYSLVSPNMTWEEARKTCKSENAELASILTPYIQSFLWLQVLKYGEPVWIGLNSNMTNEAYKWVSNWRLVYTHWAAEEPKQKIACVYLDLDGHWKTGSCNEKHFSVCEKYQGIVPTETPQQPGKCPSLKQNQVPWIPFRSHCYAIYPVRESWTRASMKCTQLGATLTSVEDLTEQRFLTEHIEELSRKEFWIGMFKNIEGEWIWQDNTEVDFVNWEGGQLHDDEFPYEAEFSFHDKCIFMNRDTGEWSKSSCDYSSKGFICKTPKIIEVSATTKPTKHDANKGIVASTQGKTVTVVLLVIFILAGASVTVYIFYRRRSRRPQTATGFDNSLYHDNEIILQNDSVSLVDNKAEN